MERSSRQRDAIRNALDAAQRPLSPLEVHRAARLAVPEIGVATVYRNLRLLQDEGAIEAVELSGEPPRYELAGHGHHHHFQCRECDRVFDVHECPGNLARLAPRGFKVERHELTLYGQCKECRASVKRGTGRSLR